MDGLIVARHCKYAPKPAQRSAVFLFLFSYKQADIGACLNSMLLQCYPTLIATYLSIGRGQLSLFDVNFAILITASPINMYMTYLALRHAFKLSSELFERRIVYCAPFAVFPVLWLALSIVSTLSTTSFVGSNNCTGPHSRIGFHVSYYLMWATTQVSSSHSSSGLAILWP